MRSSLYKAYPRRLLAPNRRQKAKESSLIRPQALSRQEVRQNKQSSGIVHSPTRTVNPTAGGMSSKKHRFSLLRFFKLKDENVNTTKEAHIQPMPLPTEILTRKRNGSVMVSGKRVPFMHDTQKRRRKFTKPLPSIFEDRPFVTGNSSLEAYRRRAYYSAAKEKNKR
ncbi:hypothetical protein CCR75_003524 [Bremia lactucae]|uniref:Uncharacterized protein n=1 Tax=Bremia lactucae TaxID=4779 RepID=A0A976FRF0_BRELC|nr:hypothetical protein CCR75_003524 [Bremia lactucae]